MTIENRLKEERVRLDMSLVDVADICGVKKQSVHQWENGGAIQLAKIAPLVARGFDVQYIVTGVRSTNLNAVQAAKDDGLETRLKRLSETQRHIIEGMIEELEKMREAQEKTETARGQGRDLARLVNGSGGTKNGV